MKTIVYVDGFNLFNRSLKGTAYKWLDLLKLSQILLPENDIRSIKYFTAKVSDLGDPKRPIRQQTYIRALKKHIPSFRVHYGNFQSHVKTAPIACPAMEGQWVKIHDTKEKGTDVNLAAHLITDAWRDIYECAVIISNDSDLVGAIELIQKYRYKRIGVIFPHNCHASVDLSEVALFVKKIRPVTLANSQLPEKIPGSNLRKPDKW